MVNHLGYTMSEIVIGKNLMEMFKSDGMALLKTNDLIDVYIPPIIPINNIYNNFEVKNKLSDSYMKLYRKKPIKHNNKILDKMNLAQGI